VKKLGMPLAIFRIEDGYGIHPRWSDVVRKGKMRCYVSRVVEPEEYRDMTNEDLFCLIERELSTDEGRVTGQFVHRKNAEFLERAIYTCPNCGFAKQESREDIITCTKCGNAVRHLPTKELLGVDKAFPHRFVADWYTWQEAYVNSTDLTALTEQPVFTDTVRLLLVHPYKNKEVLTESTGLALYGDRLELDGQSYPFDSLSAVVVLGKNKLNLYTGDRLLQVQGDKRFNALKYVHFYHRYQNIKTGDQNGKFLGL
jgi:ribosomal protein L37AE/L43A